MFIIQTKQKDGFKITKNQIASRCNENTKILVLNYPSNPTGSTYNYDELCQIAEICKEKNLIVISDEISPISPPKSVRPP